MFNRKLISELERTIREQTIALEVRDDRIKELYKDKERLLKQFDDLQDKLYKAPEDCKIGAYCAACEFGKKYTILNGNGSFLPCKTFYICGKSEACKNFVSAGGENND